MSVEYYAGLLRTGSRVDAFRRAIGEAVGEGDRVLEIGTGLGTFAFLAARAGAAAVCAVDSGAVVHVAREVARANGLDDRIDFVRGRVPDVPLPAPFDVVLFEDFPSRLMDETTFRLLRHVEEELLAPGGRFLPAAARLRLAPLRSPHLRRRLFPLETVVEAEPRAEGGLAALDWSAALPYLANQPRSLPLRPELVAAPPASGPRLPLLPPPAADALTVEARWTLPEGGTIDALALWFDLQVGGDAWLTNAPGPGCEPWGQLTLPLDPPICVAPGGRLEARAGREAFADGAPGWLVWEAGAGSDRSRGHEFAAYPAALEDLFAAPPG